MKIREVTTDRDIRQFLDLPGKIYRNDPHWIRPLDKDIEEVFDPRKNKLFQKGGKCKRWILLDDNEVVIGRVATFVNPKYKEEQPTGGMGFFEIIEDSEAAFFLLNHCRDWLKAEGMEAMDGPINFGERDRWWGMVIKGYFDPLYCMNYNPPYYVDFFEKYGFQIFFKQLCFGMPVDLNLLEDKFFTRHEEISRNPDIRVDNIKKNRLEKYARDFATVYNNAWAGHGGGKTLDERVAIKMFQSMKPVLDEKINWLVYEKDEPIACWINLPDLNTYFRHLHGKFGLWQKLKFLWLKKTLTNQKFIGIVFGVVPEWQGKGVDAYMIIESCHQFMPISDYNDYEMQWIGDFNPKMINVAQGLGAKVTRELATYRYLFDQEQEFKRHRIL